MHYTADDMEEEKTTKHRKRGKKEKGVKVEPETVQTKGQEFNTSLGSKFIEIKEAETIGSR